MIIVFFKKLFRIPQVVEDQYPDERRRKSRSESSDMNRKIEDEFNQTMRILTQLGKDHD